MMAYISLVVFDIAGTTVEDAGQVPQAFTAALRSHGIEVTKEALSGVRGASKREAIQRLVAAHTTDPTMDMTARSERIYAEFCRELERRFTAELRPVPGAPEIFPWLRGRGIKVALNTGFDRAMTNLILGVLGWKNGTVDAVVCGEETTGVLCVHQVVNVGDTTLDLQAGWNAGVAVNIGVLSGAHTNERLEQAPHTALVSSVAALPDIWAALSREAAAYRDAGLERGAVA
jgi:phosphonatase-like hydrolase